MPSLACVFVGEMHATPEAASMHLSKLPRTANPVLTRASDPFQIRFNRVAFLTGGIRNALKYPQRIAVKCLGLGPVAAQFGQYAKVIQAPPVGDIRLG